MAQTAKTNFQREYVSGGQLAAGTLPVALPQASDASLPEFDYQTREQMLADPDVSAAVWMLKESVLADEVELSPAVAEKDSRHALAVEIKEFCARAVTNLQRPLEETLEDLFVGAFAHGHKVAEKTYRIPVAGPDAYKLTLKSLKVKPHKSVAFVVDPYSNVLGFVYARPGANQAPTGAAPDPASILPREKFAVLAFGVRDEDPRGRSRLRPAFNAWKLKQLTWPEYLRWLLQCAMAGLVGTTAENAEDEVLKNADGTPRQDADGNPVYITAQEAMVAALQQFRNGTAAAFPFGAKVEPLEVASEGDPFLKAINLYGEQITIALLYQALATREGEHQARASSETQMGVLDLLIYSLKRSLARLVRSDILRDLVRYNYGDEAAEDLTPLVSLGDSERRNWATDADAVQKLIATKELTPSQVLALLLAVGLNPPEPGEKTLREIEAEGAKEAAGQKPPQEKKGDQA
jgi:hypothetical protein